MNDDDEEIDALFWPLAAALVLGLLLVLAVGVCIVWLAVNGVPS